MTAAARPTLLAPKAIEALAAQLYFSCGLEVINIAHGAGISLAVSRHSTTTDDVAAAFETARETQSRQAATDYRKRPVPFIRFHDPMLTDQLTLEIAQAETFKARNYAFEEAVDPAGVTSYYGCRAPEFHAPKIEAVRSRSRSRGVRCTGTTRESAIAPWHRR